MPPAPKGLIRSDLVAEIERLETLLARYDAVPEDTFNLGTVIRFAYNNNQGHWHLIKTAENTWKYVGGQNERSLPEWVIHAIDANLGYFEVYVLSPGESPIYVNEV